MSEVARVSDHSGVRVPRAFFVLNMPGGSRLLSTVNGHNAQDAPPPPGEI